MPVSWHIVHGSYRADRHGPRPVAAVAGATALQVDVPPLPAALASGLRERGLQLVLDLWAKYEDWQPEKLVVLHEAGAVTDTLEEYAAIIGRDGKVQTTARGHEVPHPLLRLQSQAQRTLMLLLNALDLKED